MDADKRSRYFQELTLNLQHDGFTVKPEPKVTNSIRSSKMLMKVEAL